MTSLAGKVAIVTGGGRGLGRSHAMELAKLGAIVIVNDVGVAQFTGEGAREDPASEVVEAIMNSGGQAVVDRSDIADWDGAEGLVAQTVDRFGKLDILVNNAAISRFGSIDEISREDWESSIRVNLTGTASMCHWASAHWRAIGWAPGRRIVNTTSGVGLIPVKNNPMYVASKAGVAALTVACALELAELGVRANALAPVARTRISESVAGDRLRATNGEFDKMDPANVSPLVGYLASPACRFTGRIFGIVGSMLTLFDGWTAAQSFDNDGRRWTQADIEGALARVPLQFQSNNHSIPGVIPHLTPSDETVELINDQ